MADGAPGVAGDGSPDGTSGAATGGVPWRRLRLAAGTSVLVLLVQFFLGMANNLFVTIPHRHPWTAATPAGLLWAHVVLGVALLGNAFVVLNRSRAADRPAVAGCALLALVGVVVAIAAGVAFVGGDQAAGASMAMSAGFALAVAGYAGILWLAAAAS